VNIALIGASGLVGQTMIQVLQEKGLTSKHRVLLAASSASIGKSIFVNGVKIQFSSVEDVLAEKPDFALFSAGGEPSKYYAPLFTAAGVCVIDNSSYWRMDPKVPLVVPEINGNSCGDSLLIANPNCSTIQLVVVLSPLHKKYRLKRVIVSTYQSVTGTGKKAVDQLLGERTGNPVESVYPWPIDLNCIPQCDVFTENDYTKEEMKIIRETRKILDLDELAITATAVRVPVLGGHSESVNIELEQDFTIEEVRDLLGRQKGILIQDDPQNSVYPMPIHSQGKDDVLVGRIRKDESQKNTLNTWITADNLRKGAATNAVQILEYLLLKRHGIA
jgi:aspartate-semialdehyde dehydrogenase